MKFGSGDFKYELVDNWAKLPEDETFLDVPCIRMDESGRLYIITRGKNPVMVFDTEGNMLSSWGEGLFKSPHGGCLGPDDSIFIVDSISHLVDKYTRQGHFIFRMGEKDKHSDTGYADWTPESSIDFEINLETIVRGAPPFHTPTNIVVAPSGDLYVSDGYGNARVHKFNSKGKLISSWGQPGREAGQFRVPHAVVIDKHQRLWVPDRQNGRIQIFDLEGKFIDQWIGFSWPCDLAIDEDENVYVAELKRGISILDKNGKLVARYHENEEDTDKAVLLAPHGIEVDSKGNIYVGEVASSVAFTDRRGRAVQKFARI